MAQKPVQDQVYQPLSDNSIRVLSLHPGRIGSEIQCSLTEIPLHSKDGHSYEALSYVWGAPEPTSTIKLNGQTFIVRRNLFAAFSALRLKRRNRMLWIDALCINQEDIPERNAQVSIMSHVYREAQSVLAWLGEEDESTEDLFKVVTWSRGDLSKAYQFPSHNVPDGPCIEATYNIPLPSDNSRAYQRKGLARFQFAPYARIQDALRLLCSRPYWTRVWTIQEVLSAATVSLICGSKTLPLEFLTSTHSLFDHVDHHDKHTAQIFSSPAFKIAQTFNLFRRGNLDSTLARLLRLCVECKSQCQDSKDKIYGVLSLASNGGGPVPNYNQSSLDLYLELLSTIFRQSYDTEETRLRELLKIFSNENISQHYMLPPRHRRMTDLGNLERESTICQHLNTFLIHPVSVIISSEIVVAQPEIALPDKDAYSWWDKEKKPSNLFFRNKPSYINTCSCTTRPRRRDQDPNHASIVEKFFAIHHRHWTPITKQRMYVLENTGLLPDEWDKYFDLMDEFMIEPRPIDQPAGFDKESRFLTAHGDIGISLIPGTGVDFRAQIGDILCHVDRTETDFVVVRMLGPASYSFVGPATLLEPKL